MQPSLPNRTRQAGVVMFVLSLAITRPWPRIGLAFIAASFLLLGCAGAGDGFRSLLVTARTDWARLGRAANVHRRLWMRRARQATRPSATVVLAWQLVMLIFVAIILSPALGLSADGANAAFATALSIAFAVALLDLCVMGLGVMRWDWARSAGKAMKTLVGTLIAALAIGMARHTVFDLAGEDPTKFPGTLAVLTALYVPLAWATVATVIATLTLLPALVISLGGLRDGNGYFLAKCAKGVRPLLICTAVLSTGWNVSAPDVTHAPFLRAAGIVLLVHMDFWKQAACNGEPVLSARVSDNRYVVATVIDNGPALRTLPCPIP